MLNNTSSKYTQIGWWNWLFRMAYFSGLACHRYHASLMISKTLKSQPRFFRVIPKLSFTKSKTKITTFYKSLPTRKHKLIGWVSFSMKSSAFFERFMLHLELYLRATSVWVFYEWWDYYQLYFALDMFHASHREN